MPSFESELIRALKDIHRDLDRIARLQRVQILLFRKAYNLSHADVQEEDEQFRRDWA